MTEKRRPCKRCGKNRAERFFVSSRGRVCVTCRKQRTRQAARNQRLADTYDLQVGEYEQMVAAQGGGCAICGRQPKYRLDIDHDHKLAAVLEADHPPPLAVRMSIRGLLCKPCNRRLLPAARDNIGTLQAAIRYLASPPALEVLHARP